MADQAAHARALELLRITETFRAELESDLGDVCETFVARLHREGMSRMEAAQLAAAVVIAAGIGMQLGLVKDLVITDRQLLDLVASVHTLIGDAAK